jgi:hypothetical protein
MFMRRMGFAGGDLWRLDGDWMEIDLSITHFNTERVLF